jgi:hypothetical protein
MAANSESAVISGTYQLGNVPSALLKYDKDKDYAGMVVYIQRQIAAFTYLIRERLPRQQVTSHEPTLSEVTERAYKFNVYSSGPSGSSTVMVQDLIFTDDKAANLQRGDQLQVDGIYFNGTATWTTTFAAASGPKEVIDVITVGNAGSSSTGYTIVTVSRGYGGTGAGTPTQITAAMNLILMTSASGEGSRSRKSIGKNLATASNYVQLFREPYEATDFEMDEELFYKERPEQINANLASLLLMKKIEFTFWGGRAVKTTDTSTGKLKYTTGGIINFIPKDSDHQISFGGVLTAPGLNSLFKDVFLLGGSTEKWLFCGYSFLTALDNAYDNKIQLNMPMVERYGIQIKTIQTSTGGIIHIVPSFALTEMGYDWEAFVLDMGTSETPFIQYMYMEDIYINTGRDGKGIQANDEFIRKEEFVGKLGLILRASQYQSHIYGVTKTT